MSKLTKMIGKKSLIAATSLDLLGILLSFLINANLTNDLFLKIVLFCYCVRFELIVLLLFSALFFLFSRFLKSAKYVSPALCLGMTLLIVVAMSFSIKPAKRYIIARYYYFNNNFYTDETQKRFLDKAQNHMSNNEWDLCVQSLSQAEVLYPKSYYSPMIHHAIDEANLYIKYGSFLHDTYIKPVKSEIPLNTFKCAQTLSVFYPDKYGSEYSELRDRVIEAINAYPQLYKYVESNEYERCRELILKYGWCWFEPTVYERLSYDSETNVMKWLNQYLGAEEGYSAQCRIVRNWFGEDSVSTIIQ